MRIASRFLRVSRAYAGTRSREGWLEIDIRALDLDGVTKLHVNLDDVALAQEKGDEATETMDAWDRVFGKEDDPGPPPPII
jgi:hypothetical protein